MAPMLTDMPSDRLDALIKHPFHRESAERQAGFIEDLRQCQTPRKAGMRDAVAWSIRYDLCIPALFKAVWCLSGPSLTPPRGWSAVSRSGGAWLRWLRGLR